jgi:hypothetical protein
MLDRQLHLRGQTSACASEPRVSRLDCDSPGFLPQQIPLFGHWKHADALARPQSPCSRLRRADLRVGFGLPLGEDPAGAVALPAPEEAGAGLSLAVPCGNVQSVRVRSRMPLIGRRLDQAGGRPGFMSTGNRNSGLAHCSLGNLHAARVDHDRP